MAKDARTRAKARAQYEAGHSLNDIAKELDLDRKSVLAWSKKEGWIKGRKGPELDRKAEEALEAEAERHGVTKARILAKVGQLLDAESVAVITTQGAVSLAPLQPDAKTTKGKADFMGIAYDVVPDRSTQIAAAKMGIDVLGMKKVTIDPSEDFRNLWNDLKGAA